MDIGRVMREEPERIAAAFERATESVRQESRITGIPLVFWRDGRCVWEDADGTEVPRAGLGQAVPRDRRKAPGPAPAGRVTAPVTGRPPGLILELPASAADGDFAEYTVTVLGEAVALSFLIRGRPHRVRMLWVSEPLTLVAGRSNAYGLRIVDRNAADGRQLEGGRFEVRLGADNTYDRGFFDRYRGVRGRRRISRPGRRPPPPLAGPARTLGWMTPSLLKFRTATVREPAP